MKLYKHRGGGHHGGRVRAAGRGHHGCPGGARHCTAAAAAAEAALGANVAAEALAVGAVAGGVQRQGGRAARVNYVAFQNGGGANGASPLPAAAAAAAPLRAAVEAANAALSAVADSVVAAEKAKIEWKTNVGTSALL